MSRIMVSLRWLLIMLIASGTNCFFVQLAVHARVQAGQPHAPVAHAVSMRFSQWVGFCGGCYCGAEIRVNPQKVTLFRNALRECQQRDARKYRDFRVDSDISGKHWKELQHLADKDILFTLPNTTGCASCVDGMDEMIEVTFSDGTKKSVQFPAGTPPKEIKPLHEKLSRWLSKLEGELVNYNPASLFP